MDKFGAPWSGHGENLPVAFTGHGSFNHSPVRSLRWFPSSRDCESIRFRTKAKSIHHEGTKDTKFSMH